MKLIKTFQDNGILLILSVVISFALYTTGNIEASGVFTGLALCSLYSGIGLNSPVILVSSIVILYAVGCFGFYFQLNNVGEYVTLTAGTLFVFSIFKS